jgi:hypothetical protein
MLFSVWLTYAALGGVEDVLDVRDLRMRYGETGVLAGSGSSALALQGNADSVDPGCLYRATCGVGAVGRVLR